MILDTRCQWNNCGAPLEVESAVTVTSTSAAPCICGPERELLHVHGCPAGYWTEDLEQRRVRCLDGHAYDELVLLP